MTVDMEALVEHGTKVFKKFKEDAVRTHGNAPPGLIAVFRAEQIIALVEQPEGDGRAITRMIGPTIVAFRADAIAFLSDTYRLTLEPVDGKPAEVPKWFGPGALAERWARGQHKGITEALMIVGMTAEESRAISLEYVRKGRRITWGESWDLPYDQMEGTIPDAFRSAFATRPEYAVQSAAAAAVFALDDDEARLRIDAVAIRNLGEMGCKVAWMGSPEEMEKMEEYLRVGESDDE